MDKVDNGFEISKQAFKIGEAAITGMLYEVSGSPKPGLVSPFSSGVHSDMDYFTFLKSASSIAYAFYLCAQIGIDYSEDILSKIRAVGIDAEEEMFRATNGVNTHRGLLFAAGIVCAAAGSCIREGIKLSRNNISDHCKGITFGIVDRELKAIKDKPHYTHGERIFLKHGITGIRGEAENGFTSVTYTGLPLYEESIKKGYEINKALVQSLLGIMTVAEDTVVINKAGIDGLKLMRAEAKKALELGGIFTPQGQEHIKVMEETFKKHRISPGGAADLAAITAMIYELENMEV